MNRRERPSGLTRKSISRGYKVTADNYYGILTISACYSFQNLHRPNACRPNSKSGIRLIDYARVVVVYGTLIDRLTGFFNKRLYRRIMVKVFFAVRFSRGSCAHVWLRDRRLRGAQTTREQPAPFHRIILSARTRARRPRTTAGLVFANGPKDDRVRPMSRD